MRRLELVEEPVIQFAMIFEFERTKRMCNSFECIGQAMGEVVHRIDVPLVAGILMTDVPDPIQRRITHVHIVRPHVDPGAQDVLAVGKLTVAHASKQIEIFLDTALPERAVFSSIGKRAAILTYFFGTQAVNIGLAHFDQLLRSLVQLIEIIGRMRQAIFPVESQPPNVFLDCVDVFFALLARIGVVEAQKRPAAILLSNAEIETNRLRVPDVQKTIRFRRKSCHHFAVVFAALDVVTDDLTNKILGFGFIH